MPRLFALSLLTITLLCSLVEGRDRQAAREAYRRARGYHDTLLDAAEERRSLKQYKRAIFLYRTVIDQDPTYGACDDTLYAMGNLYQDMAERFQNETYRKRAIYYYEFLADQYPLTKHKKAARKRAGLLKSKTSTAKQTVALGKAPSALATISEIRYWSNRDYTRVVIQLDREVSFQKSILTAPDRIYFDLQRSKLAPGLEGRSYQVNDLFIKGIRVAQNRSEVARVVLDFEKINRHTVFALYDPFRIVIDTQGGKQSESSARGETLRTAEAVISPKGTDANAVRTDKQPLASTPNISGDRTLTRVLGLKVGRVVLDPGHGGRDTGTVGRSGLREKDLVLAVSQHLKELLETRLQLEVVLTRETDKFVPLEERTAIANHLGADLFLSIHANSSRSRQTSGAETFFQGFSSHPEEREVAARENASSQRNVRELENLLRRIALGDHNEESRDFALVLQNRFHSQIRRHRSKFRDRGVKKAPFIVLINLNMPGILLEIGFLSNPSEEQYLERKQGQDQVAEAIYLGIEKYLRSLGGVPSYDRTAKSGGS